MTCFDKDKNPTNYPLAVLEWKFKGFREKQKNIDKQFEGDILWLKNYTKENNVIGYAILMDSSEKNYKLKVFRIFNGTQDKVVI